jgi:hypothetical protein
MKEKRKEYVDRISFFDLKFEPISSRYRGEKGEATCDIS